MADLIHLVMTPGSRRSACGINVTADVEVAQYATHGPLMRARQLGADIPEVCTGCIVAGRKP